MSTQFRPIQIPPGVVSMATKKMQSSNWAEVNFMRWREGQLMPMGGQAQISNLDDAQIAAAQAFTTATTTITMSAAAPSWMTPNVAVMNTTTGSFVGRVQSYVGTSLVLQAPAASASSAANNSLRFTDEHYIFASRCKKIHGWFGLDGVYHIAYLSETNLYVDTGGTLIEITPSGGMTAPAGLVGGFGDGLYDTDLYGRQRSVPSSVAITKVPDAYSLDNFGSILYAMTSADGRLLMWDPAVGGAAVVQPPASGRGPVPNGRCFVITPERFVMIFGSVNDGTAGGTSGGGPRRFAWCDQENPGAWDYSNVTSQAGFLDIEPASPIICAIATRVGVLFWTGKKIYASRFLGLPYVFNSTELADGTVPWSPQSMTTTSALTLWMSEQGMFSYDGTSIAPVPCLVRPWIDDDIDPIAVRELSFACHLGEFSEWWWFYPTLGSPTNARAAVYNYKEGWFSQVRMSRSAGITSSYTAHPIFADDYVAFQHEVGVTYANASMPVQLPFAETFDLNILGGSRLITVKQMIPDVEALDAPDDASTANAIGNLRYSMFYRNSRSLGAPELQSSLQPVRSDGYVDFRQTGRDIRLRIDVASPVIQPFTLGQHLIDAVPRGDR